MGPGLVLGGARGATVTGVCVSLRGASLLFVVLSSRGSYRLMGPYHGWFFVRVCRWRFVPTQVVERFLSRRRASLGGTPLWCNLLKGSASRCESTTVRAVSRTYEVVEEYISVAYNREEDRMPECCG